MAGLQRVINKISSYDAGCMVYIYILKNNQLNTDNVDSSIFFKTITLNSKPTQFKKNETWGAQNICVRL